ncbi:MAG TPA: ATP synthase F0 subunit B [Chloroflexi bacterium]|nr:ATP synthase F0 subunit B [Chloroflexota bacterium]|tara:strand:- start:9906 stop:10652 length:747 start_codon:yes stop_codon:yes gene_type:complete
MEALGNLGINLSYLVVQILNFFIVMLLLSVWAYKPIVKILDERSTKIAQSLEDAREAAEAKENANNEAQQIISDAQAEKAKIIAEATQRAEQAAADVHKSVEQERSKVLEQAQEAAQQYKESVLLDIRPQVASMAIAAANKIISSELDESRQKALVDEFFSGIVDGKVSVLDGTNLQGENAVVTSAISLRSEEQDKITKELKDKLGNQSEVSFRVDPGILGGIVVRVGEHEVDGSARRALETLQQSLI